jgi:regulator of protease activity HflC (stomatin/prohibitin superfamily)
MRNPLLATTGVVLVPQQSVYVVERLGRFNRVLEPGLHLVIPLVRPHARVASVRNSL